MVPVKEIGKTAMVGLDAELNTLLDELTRDLQSSRKAISIVGMGGTGKTTLAKNIFENRFIKEHFDFRGWATISQLYNAQEILAQLLSPQGKSEIHSDGDVHIYKLGVQLYWNLEGRRYLIILDDIWSVQAWHKVSRYFPDNNNGSRIVLTTRLSNVANDCGSSRFMMEFLDEANSWELFCEKVFKNESCPLELKEVGKMIVKLCKGLALSIVVVGGLLSKLPRTVEYWEDVVKDMRSISGESLNVLYLNYTHLPDHLKPCFLYMGIFEEDSEIRVSKVVKLWVAEGLIKPNGFQVLEEIGEGYLKDLMDRNLILAGRRRKNGKIGSCAIHDIMRDLCIRLGGIPIVKNLRTHKTILNLRLCTEVCKTISNIKKLHLFYDDELEGYDDCLFDYLCNLDRMRKLESLKLSIKSWTWNNQLSKKLAFPSSLNKLSLMNCGFDRDDLRMIQSLPQLEVLILGDQSVLPGTCWSSIHGQFLLLKFLKIEACLKYWVVDCSDFPVLEELHIAVCNPIFEIPSEIGYIPTLELIHVDASNSMRAAISALRIMEKQLELGNDSLQIKISIDESEQEDFKERIKSQGLYIGYPQFEIRPSNAKS